MDRGRGNRFLRLIDQTRLPMEFVEIDCREVAAVWEAIKVLRVRGAPAIGIAAAYGAVIGARTRGRDDTAAMIRALAEATAPCARAPDCRQLVLPDRMDACLASADQSGGPVILDQLLDEARKIDEEDRAMCRAIGQHGVPCRAGRGSDPLQCRRPGDR